MDEVDSTISNYGTEEAFAKFLADLKSSLDNKTFTTLIYRDIQVNIRSSRGKPNPLVHEVVRRDVSKALEMYRLFFSIGRVVLGGDTNETDIGFNSRASLLTRDLIETSLKIVGKTFFERYENGNVVWVFKD